MVYELPNDLEDPSVNPPSRAEETRKAARNLAAAATAPFRGQAFAVGLVIGYLLALLTEAIR